MKITSQKEVRALFWETFPRLAKQARANRTISKGQNAQCATIRCAFVEFVDSLERDGVISENLASKVTL